MEYEMLYEGVAGPSDLSQPSVAAFPANIEPKDEDVDQLAEDEDDDEPPETDDEDMDPTQFRIHKPLPVYREYTRQLGDVHRMIHDGLIELDPDYQRDVVWSIAKQSQLIESIFRNYTIPQIVLSVVNDEQGEEVRNCVDGKQRLTSIQRFIDGLIPYQDPKTKTKFWYTTSETHKGTRHLIPPNYREYFSTRTITISEYDKITPLQEREVFQRVQLGVSLKATEKLRAVMSPRSSWITTIEERHVSFDEGLASKINFDTKNARDFANIVTFVFLCHSLPEQIDPTNPKAERWLSNQEELDESFKSSIDEVLRNLWVIASSPQYNAVFKKVTKKVAPLEFIFICVFLYILRDVDERHRQASAIHKFRVAIRERFVDVKLNTNTTKIVWGLLREIERKVRKHDGEVFVQSPKKRQQNDESDSDFYPNGYAPKTKKAKSRSKR
ncbi:hypothetical protein CPB83DRAFT_843925 [Crepidotus variabilis]|uniref:GmrSD restriction endonucleases N-terminal domain-containing protein n=1 Tax=Crepidotus variabilis TaxID=179855 RepID=A0A9P6ESB1_9AGAR|nr:hypothetical protein CPB83DRAFT_843925 [Crepidotus variabilis]